MDHVYVKLFHPLPTQSLVNHTVKKNVEPLCGKLKKNGCTPLKEPKIMEPGKKVLKVIRRK